MADKDINHQVRKTLLLDQDTVFIFKEYGKLKAGSENISAAIRIASKILATPEIEEKLAEHRKMRL